MVAGFGRIFSKSRWHRQNQLNRQKTESTSTHFLLCPIADLLNSTVEESIAFLEGFEDSRPARRAVHALKLLEEVGLGYLKLGQPINTLSGGECQRLKLVRHLAEVTEENGPIESLDRENYAEFNRVSEAALSPELRTTEWAHQVTALFVR